MSFCPSERFAKDRDRSKKAATSDDEHPQTLHPQHWHPAATPTAQHPTRPILSPVTDKLRVSPATAEPVPPRAA